MIHTCAINLCLFIYNLILCLLYISGNSVVYVIISLSLANHLLMFNVESATIFEKEIFSGHLDCSCDFCFILTLRRLMSYIYMEHPFLMFLDHTQRRTSVGRTPLDE